MRRTLMSLLTAAVASITMSVPFAGAQTAPAVSGDWPLYRHDMGGTGYSPLAKITTRNVGGLAQAWTFRLQSDTSVAAEKGPGRARGPNSEASPIVVNGVMYL